MIPINNNKIIIATQVFTNGQQYVACSRVGSPDDIKFTLLEKENAKNVVYKEVLLNRDFNDMI